MADEEKEVAEGVYRYGSTEKYFSVSEIELQDLLSEGVIQGVSTGEYIVTGMAGELGYRYASAGPKHSFLRSVFWNKVPVMDTSNNLNFQYIKATKTEGPPNGETKITDKLKDETSVTRNISERLRGPTWIKNTRSGALDEFAKVYRVLNTDCTKIDVNFKLSSFSETNRTVGEEGEILDSKVLIVIKYRPLFSTANKVSQYQDHGTVTIVGKISSGFIWNEVVTLQNTQVGDPDFIGWELKMYRTTKESDTLDVRNETYIDGLTEYYSSKFAYPDTAMVSQRFSAEYFSSIPERAFDTRGMKVKIPSNYDPIKKTYNPPHTNYKNVAGASNPPPHDAGWNGLFKSKKYWTDNPAWCFYDLITNRRYGLGKYIDPDFVDKWSLYEIAKYCDTLVPDGYGGVEPRFACNLYIQTREDAFKIVNDMASIFRGLTYYAGGGIYTIQDSEKISLYNFTNANVKEGDFNYSNSSKKVRHTVAIIRYNDKYNYYEPAIEYVEDVDGIRKHGIRELEMAAFGCTSRGQAMRLGRWALFTENMETESISFTAGLEGAYLKPGDVFTVHDSNRGTQRWAGRVKMVDVYPKNPTNKNGWSMIVLDQNVMPQLTNDREYKFTLLTPTYNYDPSQVTDMDSDDFSNLRKNQTQNYKCTGSRTDNNSFMSMANPVYNTGEYPELSGYCILELHSGFQNTNHEVARNSIWTLEPISPDYTATELEAGEMPENKYRVIRTEEAESNEYNVAGIEYTEQKYSAIESGLTFEDSTSVTVPDPPLSLKLEKRKVSDNTTLIDYTITAPKLKAGLSTYYTYVKRGSTWQRRDFTEHHNLTTNLDADMNDNCAIPNNEYLASVLSKNVLFPQTYLPEAEGKYLFRVFSANVLGVHSNGTADGVQCSARGSMTIDKVQPLLDVTLKNFRETDDIVNATNDFGNKVFHTTEKTDYELKWSSSVGSETINLNDYTYRITVRNPTSNQTLGSILYQETGYSAGAGESAAGGTDYNSWKFPFAATAGNGGIYDVGLKRKLDFTVEAHDSEGSSSAGGSFSATKDSTYNNAKGYDKYQINNPEISDAHLGTDVGANAGVKTEASLTLDKEVKIIFRRNAHEDTQGIFLYMSKTNFSKNDILYKTVGTLKSSRPDIEVARIEPYTTTVQYTPVDRDIRNSDELYIAFSMYDSFLLAYEKEFQKRNGTSTDTQQHVLMKNIGGAAFTLTKKIVKGTQLIDQTGDGFKVWIRMKMDGSWIGEGIDKVQPLRMNFNDTSTNLPARYQAYDGYRKYACHYQSTYLKWNYGGAWQTMKFAWEDGHYPSKEDAYWDQVWAGACPENPNWPGTAAEREEIWKKDNKPGYNCPVKVDYFPNYYCGYLDTVPTFADWWRRGGKSKNLDAYNEQSYEYYTYDVATNEKEGFKRFRVYLDPALPSDKYAVIGLNINNLDYIHPTEAMVGDSYYDIADSINPATPQITKVTVTSASDGNGQTVPGGTHGYYSDHPSLLKHHPAGFGQGFANLERHKTYFDVHMGHLVDMSYLREAFFGIITKDTDTFTNPGSYVT